MFNSIGMDNLVWRDRLHKSYTVEPIATTYTYTKGSETSAQTQRTFKQYKATASVQGSYSYVGLTEAAALSAAESLLQAWTKNVSKWSVSLSTAGNDEWKYEYFPTDNVPQLGAAIKPTHTDGDMWEIGVDVDAKVEYYYDSLPSLQTVLAQADVYMSADVNAQV